MEYLEVLWTLYLYACACVVHSSCSHTHCTCSRCLRQIIYILRRMPVLGNLTQSTVKKRHHHVFFIKFRLSNISATVSTIVTTMTQTLLCINNGLLRPQVMWSLVTIQCSASTPELGVSMHIDCHEYAMTGFYALKEAQGRHHAYHTVLQRRRFVSNRPCVHAT